MIPEVAQGVTDGKIKILFENMGRVCIKAGVSIPILKVSFDASQPALSVIGTATIADILQIPFRDVDDNLAKALGLTLEDFRLAGSAALQAGSEKINFLRFSKLDPPIFDKKRPTRLFPNTPVILTNRLSEWLRGRSKVVVVDVRSKEETVQVPLKFKGPVINSPYHPKDGKNAFNWDKTVGEINGDRFDVEEILEISRNQEENATDFLVVGASPEDGRVPWALYTLLNLRLRNVYWYYDGANTFNQSL
ncbi:MAG: hypothetical protein IPJ84_03160 [Bdellovibrionales bacterium]|nr:hypothetical protein [Bdellovibrionales bacterium]